MEENRDNNLTEETKDETVAETKVVEDNSAETAVQPQEGNEAENTEKPQEENAATAAEQPSEESVAEASEQPQAEGETDKEASEEENAATALTEEEIRQERIKKIKIGVIAAGGVFILLAAVYAASLLGGKNTAIDKNNPVVAAAVEEEEEKVTFAPVTPKAQLKEDEEPPVESLLCIAQGNARYEECIYADGGVMIVKNKELYGAVDYEGKEIVACKYTDVEQLPTKDGRFVLSNSKTENITKEQDGTTYSYEDVITTYTLFDNTGKKLYEGNDQVLSSGDVYILAKEDDEDSTNNRLEYYRLDKAGKAMLTLYVNDQFSMNGFKDGKTVVMGFTAKPTPDQETNPTNLFCGTMDDKGKVSWYAKAPGIDEFDDEVAQWKEDNKVIKKQSTKKTKKSKKKAKEVLYDEDGNEIPQDETDETEEELSEESEDEELEEDELDEEEEEQDEELDEENPDDEYDDEEDLDMSAGPSYHMNEILNAPNGGYFVYKDLYDVEDSYSWYTEKGIWYADLDTAFMKADPKKGFVLGNFNNGAVEAKSYLYDGENYYNYGKYMVLTIGDKDVLIDITKGQGMTNEDLTDRIVVNIHDQIEISDAPYWLYRDGNKYGYLDLKGKELKVSYDAATAFVNGYAMVIKNGNAFIINDKLEEVEDVGAAEDVQTIGDVFVISTDSGERRYMLKSVREDPTGTKTTSSGAAATTTSGAETKEKDGSQKSKK